MKLSQATFSILFSTCLFFSLLFLPACGGGDDKAGANDQETAAGGKEQAGSRLQKGANAEDLKARGAFATEFLVWYLQRQPELKVLKRRALREELPDQYAVDMENVGAWLDYMMSSGYLSDNFSRFWMNKVKRAQVEIESNPSDAGAIVKQDWIFLMEQSKLIPPEDPALSNVKVYKDDEERYHAIYPNLELWVGLVNQRGEWKVDSIGEWRPGS